MPKKSGKYEAPKKVVPRPITSAKKAKQEADTDKKSGIRYGKPRGVSVEDHVKLKAHMMEHSDLKDLTPKGLRDHYAAMAKHMRSGKTMAEAHKFLLKKK